MSETSDIDSLAAEYVLGTLDAGERAQAQAQLRVDQALAAKVRIWERRLSELHLMVEPIEPDGEIWDRIQRRVPKPPPPPAPEPEAAFLPEPEAAILPEPEVEGLPEPEAEDRPVVDPEVIAAAVETSAPAPNPFLAPFGTQSPFARLDQPARPERPSLESLEEAVLKAADALQQRAVVETKPEPEPVENAEPEPEIAEARAEEDGKTGEVVGSTIEETIVEAEQVPEVPEVASPGTVADTAAEEAEKDEPAPATVPAPASADIRAPAPAGPLAAFPTSFSAAAPVPAPTPLVPSPPVALAVPVAPPIVQPNPSLAVRPGDRRQPSPAARVRTPWLARLIATLLALIVLAVAGLVTAWRYAPERVPQPLRPVQLLRAIGIETPTTVIGPPPRKPAPPESQYDE